MLGKDVRAGQDTWAGCDERDRTRAGMIRFGLIGVANVGPTLAIMATAVFVPVRLNLGGLAGPRHRLGLAQWLSEPAAARRHAWSEAPGTPLLWRDGLQP